MCMVANHKPVSRSRVFDSRSFLQLEGTVKVTNWFRTPGELRLRVIRVSITPPSLSPDTQAA